MELVTSLPRKPVGAKVAPFFVLNAQLRQERLHEMLEECAQSGFDGVILHPRAGLRTPYLSEAWFEAIDYCVKEAARLGLKSWIYDEFPYPSGVAGGRVLQKNPEFAEKHLVIRRSLVEGGARVGSVLGEGRFLAAFAVPVDAGGKRNWDEARTVTSSVGVRNTTWISREWDSRFYYNTDYAKLYQCRRAIDLLPELAFEGELPGGQWELISFFIETGGDFLEPFGHYVDVSNPHATATFLAETHEAYRARFGAKFGAEIPGVFTDEPKYRNALPWSDFIAAGWSDYQEDPQALLALLPDAPEVEPRRRYRQLTRRLFSENWVQPIAAWCARQKMQLMGHISPEEDWWSESRAAGSILTHLRHFSVPGCDLIIPATGDRQHPVLNFTPSLAVSAAAQSGATHALCEVFGCSDYSLDLQTIKRVGDWLTTFGINYIVPHGCFYSLAGLRRYDAPPTFLSPSTLGPFLALWSDHLREAASRLGPRGVKVDTALVRPMDYFLGLAEGDERSGQKLFEKALGVALHLLERGIPFHWVDDEDLPGARTEAGKMVVGQAAYRRVVIMEEVMPSSLRSEVARLREAGVTLLDYEAARLIEGPLDCPEGDVRAAADREGGYFCVNLSAQPRRFRLEGMPCELDGYESRSITPSEPVGDLASQPEEDRLPLGTDWKVTPLEPNVYRLNGLTGEDGAPLGPVYDGFSGGMATARTVYGPVPLKAGLNDPVRRSYETVFHWQAGDAPLALRLEEESARGGWSVFLNGELLEAWSARPGFMGEHRLSGKVRPGANTLRIEIEAADLRDGLLIAPLLVGDFVVLDAGEALLGCRPAVMEGGDWSQLGYPHYSGTMDFETTFDAGLGNDGASVDLLFGTPPAGALEVFLNDKPMGHLLWSPWRIDLSEGLNEGENRLRLRVTNTLYNLIYGRARPSGPLGGAEIRIGAPASAASHGIPRRQLATS